MGNKHLGQIVVITGASSGIGRATAHAFAEEGARVVLAARGRESLEAAATECRVLGAEVIVVPTDVRDEGQVRALIDTAIATFGGIDVFVGNAGLAVAGRFEEIPDDVWHRVMDTNVFGHVYALRALVPYFKERDRGTYVAVASIEGFLSAPYQSAYVTSKHALLGLTDVLRGELLGTNVQVTTVLPATIDTPIYATAPNYLGRGWRPLPPSVAPQRVARAILGVVQHPRRTKYVGALQSAIVPFQFFAPGLMTVVTRLAVEVLAFRGTSTPSDGNAYEPDIARSAVDGGWRVASRRKAVPVALLSGAAAVLAVAGRRRRR